MKNMIKKPNLLLLIALLAVVVTAVLYSCVNESGTSGQTDTDGYVSISDLIITDDGTIYAADAGKNALYKITDGKITATATLDFALAAVVLDGSTQILYTVGGEENGKLASVDAETMKVLKTSDAGHTPTDILHLGATLYVSERFDNAVTAYDIATLKPAASVKTVREPSALTSAGGCVWVAGLLPDGAISDGEVFASEVAAYDPSDLSEKTRIKLTNGSTGARGIAASDDGKTVFVTHTLGRSNVATTHLDRGWVYTNAVSVINAESLTLDATVLIDDIDRGAANPWGVLSVGNTLAVAAAGTGELVTLDTEAMLYKISRASKGAFDYDGIKNAAEIADTLDFSYDFKTRKSLGTSGLRALAANETTVAAANYFTGDITLINAETLETTTVIKLGGETETEQRAGERLWNDASICYQSWLSCASCHPDARTDALNWDNLNDGIGTPKQARSMLYTFERGRVMATGIRDNAAVAVSAGVKYILFNAGLTDREYGELGAYLQSLEPVQSPYLENGKLSASAERGKTLFDKTGCASCHSDTIYGADTLVESFTQRGNETRGLLVPSLIEVWRTAPYLYDGRAATVHDVLTEFASMDENGELAKLNETELRDLEQYVLSISNKSGS